MSRVQLALNVSDLDEAIGFYTRLFQTTPHKTEAGYANFEVENPPLKLVLFEGGGTPGTLNHIGVEVSEPAEVRAAEARLGDEGLSTAEQDGVCCFAEMAKTWVTGPDGLDWEIYAVTDDSPGPEAPAAACCG